MGSRRYESSLIALSAAGAFLWAHAAKADEPRPADEPRVLSEPAEMTQIADSFDDGDDFDLNLSLGFQHSIRGAKIRRESAIDQPGLTTGGFTHATLNVAEYSESTSRLLPKAEVGLYKDISLILRLPIILSNKRELKSLDGSGASDPGTVAPELAGGPGEQLFSLPFTSPTRSGLEYFAAGFEFGIMNQFREYTKPTWVFGFEGRFSVSEPMHACNQNPAAGQLKCANISDINRDGEAGSPDLVDESADHNSLEGNFSGGRSPGVSRGTTGIEVHSYLSKRVKFIEPYGGFSALFEFQNDSSDYGATDLEGSLVNHPPLRGSMVVGMQVVPWEVRERFQRVSFDFRFTGTYVSEGRDYSELFDALGSSSAASLRYPNYAAFQANTDTQGADATNGPNTPAEERVRSVVNPGSQKVYFTGLTDVQAYGVYQLGSSFTWQAGEYVKFTLGGSFLLSQAHFVAFDQACNPDFSGSLDKAGPCHRASDATAGTTAATGLPNPNFRRTINDPGRRFKVTGGDGLDGWVNATVMF